MRSGSGNAAAILPAHQRMHLGVFVDRLVDDDQQALARQRQHMLMQIGIVARMRRRPVAIALERRQRSELERSSIGRLTRASMSRSHAAMREGRGVLVGESDDLQAERQFRRR